MDTDKVNRGLTLAANVGVLGGLILVAFQINQHTQIAKAQMTNDYYLADMQLELVMMGDDPARSWTKAVYSPNDLTNEDAAVVDRYFNYGMVQIERLQKMHELGLAGDDWENRIDYLSWHFGNEVGQRWWAYSKQFYPDELVRMVDDSLANRVEPTNRAMLDALMPEANAEQN